MHLSVSFPASSDSAPSLVSCQPLILHLPLPFQVHYLPRCAVPTPMRCVCMLQPGHSGFFSVASHLQLHPAPPPASSTRGHRSDMCCSCCLQVSPYPFKHGHDSVSLLRLGHDTDVGTPGLMSVSSVGRGRSGTVGQAACVLFPGTLYRQARQQGMPCHTLCNPETPSGGHGGLTTPPGP